VADEVDHSDFFTIVNVFNSWRRASDNPNFVPVFCRKNFVSQQVSYPSDFPLAYEGKEELTE
jgi:hypothetical protein